MKFAFAVGAFAAISSASAFVPAVPAGRMAPAVARSSATRVMGKGKYDGELWDDAAKKDVLSEYDPSKPRSELNFDPFKRDSNGNMCDSSGFYPGDGKYKDPIRPKVSYEEYLKQRAEAENK